MIRLNMIVEGQTEQAFVKNVLSQYLASYHIYISVRCVETGRNKSRIYRGGMTGYEKAEKDIHRWMKEDKNEDARFTTMFDLYGLPADFPGFDDAKKLSDPYLLVEKIETSFEQDICDRRFIPYIQLHEYESLILTDPDKFKTLFIGADKQINKLKELISHYSSPELINDGEETAPSKRIIKEMPLYKDMKSTAGPIIAQKIGLEAIRQKCSHFNEWVIKLESLAN
ncbi:MAG: hypothetical protein BWK80_04965 [Desulfobacteraceae bacterium IS3]|nr:MAG: hypothetical protein BWK80_04965 [Desulfobacteraceae bacterium IS3]